MRSARQLLRHTAVAAGWQKVGRLAASSGLFGADLPTNTDLLRRVRKAQDLRQRFSRQLFRWKRVAPLNRESPAQRVHFAEGVVWEGVVWEGVVWEGVGVGGRGTRTHKPFRTTVF